ncbi:MAG: UDP-2,3-diacylglucosamine diphosphatase, partial [Planctomycetota bacterium]|nr:UDP-2,3-diacylglucosamine diphosphatase [Planctomycetota bacterium]
FSGYLGGLDPARDELYVLGDLFNFWSGHRTSAYPPYREAIEALQSFAKAGGNTTLLQGNREPFLGGRSGEILGVTVAGDDCSFEAKGLSVGLVHGDTLCTFDTGYQRLRRILRSAPFQTLVPALPLWVTVPVARWMERGSASAKSVKTSGDMGIVDEAALGLADARDWQVLIAGHVHIPETRRLPGVTLVVLPPWNEPADALVEEEGVWRWGDGRPMEDLP